MVPLPGFAPSGDRRFEEIVDDLLGEAPVVEELVAEADDGSALRVEASAARERAADKGQPDEWIVEALGRARRA